MVSRRGGRRPVVNPETPPMTGTGSKRALFLFGDSCTEIPGSIIREINSSKDGGLIALAPESLRFPYDDVDVRRYPPPFSIVRHSASWLDLRSFTFERILIVGSGKMDQDKNDIVCASLLHGSQVLYVCPDSASRDISGIIENLRIDFAAREPRMEELEDEGEHRAKINEHYLGQLTSQGYHLKHQQTSQKSRISHFESNVGLADDIAMRDPAVSQNPWWVQGYTAGQRLVSTVDVRLAYARILERLPGVESALEVGCGSGFVSLFLAAWKQVKKVEGNDVVSHRVDGAKLLAGMWDLGIMFSTQSVQQLQYEDDSFDLVHTCFVLEQCHEILPQALDELMRVSRKWVMLFEPSVEAYPTLPGMIHIHQNGFPTNYSDLLFRF